MWSPNREDFRLVHFFDWYGAQCGYRPDEGVTWSFYGSLKKDAIQTDSHRIAYVRGALAGYGRRTSDTVVTFSGANYCQQLRRVGEFFRDIRSLPIELSLNWHGGSITYHASYSCPICSTMTINSTKEHLDAVFGAR